MIWRSSCSRMIFTFTACVSSGNRMCVCHERRVPVDILTVSEELDDMSRLDEIGGQAYLTALLNQVPTTLHAEAYGKNGRKRQPSAASC